MRTVISLMIGVLLVGLLTSGACNCGCNSCKDCFKCKPNCCAPAKNICSVSELMDYNCPCVPVCSICVRVDFCGCDGLPLNVTFKAKGGAVLGTFEMKSREQSFRFEDSVMANTIDEVVFTPAGEGSASITGVKIWSDLGHGEKVTLANFDNFNPAIIGGEKGCGAYVIF